MRRTRKTNWLAAVTALAGAASWPATASAAYDDCAIGNSAPVVWKLGRIYLETVRTSGFCYPEDDLDPYICIVWGRTYGGLAAPTDSVGIAPKNELENFCEATGTLAISLENCQQWYVLGEYRTPLFTDSQSGFEYACA